MNTMKQVKDGVSQVKENVARGAKDIATNSEHKEGPVAKTIENQTAKLPSDLFLWTALGSMALSAGLQIAGRKETSNFVGLWAPCFLLLGIYNKIVKVAGNDKAMTA